MILTGKAKEDFTKWNGDRQFDMMLPFEYPIYLNALIIEWLDSVGIFIELYKYDYFVPYIVYGDITEKGYDESDSPFETRQEAIKSAIIKANKMYNEHNLSIL